MLVSIIIPVYKNHKYLEKSLESVINQTYKSIEIIIINDGDHNDRTIRLILNKYQHFKKIRYFKLKKNMGVSYALNYGIKKSYGKYINWLSHDDYFHKEKLKIQIDYIKKTNSMICYSSFFTVNESLKILKKYNSKIKLFDPILHILVRDNLNFCTFLISKSIFNDIGFFDLELKHIQDYDMFYRIFKKYKPLYISKPLFYSRIHKKQSSVLLRKSSEKEKKLFSEKTFNDLVNLFLKINLYKKCFVIVCLSRRQMNNICIKLLKVIKIKNYFLYILLNLILKISK